jgi:hypothetical protein
MMIWHPASFGFFIPPSPIHDKIALGGRSTVRKDAPEVGFLA